MLEGSNTIGAVSHNRFANRAAIDCIMRTCIDTILDYYAEETVVY
jgi:hypothetical protein